MALALYRRVKKEYTVCPFSQAMGHGKVAPEGGHPAPEGAVTNYPAVEVAAGAATPFTTASLTPSVITHRGGEPGGPWCRFHRT